MQQDQAAQLLSAGLDANLFTGNETVALLELVARLGEWPLLLTLINGALREKVNRGQRFPDALTSINKALERRGLTAFDAHNPEERSQAVARTLGVSFELLSVNDRARYRELVIFPEDVDIPLTTVAKLWSMTGKLDEVDTDEVCEHLYEL